MKKINLITLSIACVCFILSCKHEIPGQVNNEPGPGTPGNNPGPGGSGNSCSPDSVYFVQQVLPIFISNCSLSGCHDATSRQDGVLLTSYSSIMSTGEIVPGRPRDSEVYEKIMEEDHDDRMPPRPRNPLTTEQKSIIAKWITQGAKNNSCENLVCDTATVTFTASIKPIIINKCGGCHSGGAPQGGIDFSTYAGVKAKVTDGRLWGAINHTSGFSPMPKNGTKLSDCEIAKFRIWIAAGAQNN